MKRFLIAGLLTLCAAFTATAQSDSIQISPDINELLFPGSTTKTEPANAENLHPASVDLVCGPWVFSGYRSLVRPKRVTQFPDSTVSREVWKEVDREFRRRDLQMERERIDSLLVEHPDSLELLLWDPYASIRARENDLDRELPPVAGGDITPDWLRNSLRNKDIQLDAMYTLMIEQPVEYLEYTLWDLPIPPKLPQEDYSFHGYLKRLNIPIDHAATTVSTPLSGERINWLHVFNTGLQLSQAYVSKNWYQGGTSYLAFLFNFLWDVQLNKVYHPKTMFQSTLSYKFSVNSTPDDKYHKYSISQDLFQYNLKAGYKAAHNWYYSFLLQFKTQFFNSYPANSEQRAAAFLSPGELNLGIGMTYNRETANKRFKLTASISPASYNFKTCISDKVEHSQFGIKPERRWKNEIGSNAELTVMWKIWDNITYNSRLFLFTDYKSFQGDWENTFNFQFNRFFSTQLYFHLRYDSEADGSISKQWNKWMLKEILSVGVSYTFSTK